MNTVAAPPASQSASQPGSRSSPPFGSQPPSPPSKLRHSNPFGHLGRLRRLVAPAVSRPFAVVEAIALTLAALALSRYFAPDDPLLLKSGFSWLWLAPLVVALRYGTLVGLLCGALVVGDWLMFADAHGRWPVFFFTGGLLQTIIAGHFGDTWGSRAIRASALNDYLNDRLVALTNSHYLMRLSHERLEKDLLSKPTTLRDAITELRRLSVTEASGLEGARREAQGDNAHQTRQQIEDVPEHGPMQRLAHGAQALVEFVAQACQIDVAALYGMHDGRISSEPIASVGDAFVFDAGDPLVARACETRQVAHLTGDDRLSATTQLLACAPLVAADGSLLGLLAVKRMPFLSLNFDNLQLLGVLLGYYADGVEHARLVREIVDAVPACPPDFALDLGRLTRLARDAGIASSLVALVFPHDEAGDSLFEHVMRRRRSLDLVWPIRTPSESVIVSLMPATDGTGVDGYLARIEASLEAQFHIDLERAHIAVHTLHLTGAEPGHALQRLLKRSGVDG